MNSPRNNPLLLNPQAVQTIIPYAIYNTHKVARKQMQAQRQQAQHTISFLERQAKRSVKQLQHKQKSLVDFYKLKETRFLQMKKKEQLQRKKEEELQRQRQTNTNLRESSANRRNTVRKQWQNTNRKMARDVKSFRSESQRKLSEQRDLERSLLKKRNQMFSQAIALGNEHSRIKTFYSKRFISSQVKNDLISVQESIKNRELQRISDLSLKQQQLLEIVEKTRRQHHTYDHTLTEMKTLPFEKIYPKIKSVQPKSTRTRRQSHDSLII